MTPSSLWIFNQEVAMASYQLREGQGSIRIKEGPLAGRRFRPGAVYGSEQLKGLAAIDRRRFDRIAATDKKPAEADKKRGDSKS
jgi:hypothetical protein